MVAYFFQQMRQQVASKQNTVNELDVYYFSVRPKLSQQCLKQLLFGHLDIDDDSFASRADDINQPVGLFPLISEFDSSLLCAISAA